MTCLCSWDVLTPIFWLLLFAFFLHCSRLELASRVEATGADCPSCLSRNKFPLFLCQIELNWILFLFLPPKFAIKCLILLLHFNKSSLFQGVASTRTATLDLQCNFWAILWVSVIFSARTTNLKEKRISFIIFVQNQHRRHSASGQGKCKRSSLSSPISGALRQFSVHPQ